MIELKRRPTHPGLILKELYLNGAQISVSDFAARIGVSRKTMSAIINGRQRVTPEMAVRFAKAFPNTTPVFWLNLQNACDVYDAKKALGKITIEPIPAPIADTPAMARA